MPSCAGGTDIMSAQTTPAGQRDSAPGGVFSRPKTRRHPAARPHPRGVQRHDGKPHRATAPPVQPRGHSHPQDNSPIPGPGPHRATVSATRTRDDHVEQHDLTPRRATPIRSTDPAGVRQHVPPARSAARRPTTCRQTASSDRPIPFNPAPTRTGNKTTRSTQDSGPRRAIVPEPANEPTATAPSRRHDPHVYSDGSPSDAFRHDDNRPAGQARSDPKTDTNTRTATRRPEPHLVAAEDCGGGGLRPGHPRDRPGRSRGSQAMSPHRRSPWLLET